MERASILQRYNLYKIYPSLLSFLSGDAQPPLVLELQSGWQPAPHTSIPPPSIPKESPKPTQHPYKRRDGARFYLYAIPEKATLICGDRNQQVAAWPRGRGPGRGTQ